MDFAETEELQLIRQSIREVASDYDYSYWKDCFDTKTFPQEYWDDLSDAGWVGAIIPTEYGGGGLGMKEMAVIIEELGRGGDMGASSTVFVLTPVFGGITIQEHGTDSQKERYLPAIAAGEMRFCMALTEASAGTNTLNIKTAAEQNGEQFVVDGQKMWTSGVENADEMLLIARTSEADDHERASGLTMFLVPDPANQPGIDIAPLDVGIPEFETQYQVNISNLAVPEDRVLGKVDHGLSLLWDTLNTERIAGAATALGGGLRALDLAVDYAKERVVFDEPIGGHQAIQHPLAESYAKLQSARTMTYKAAWEYDTGAAAGATANIAKLLASQAATEMADRAIQTHGGNGFARDYEVYDIWQIARLTQTTPVPNEMVKNYLAEHALDLPRSY